jgi:hypothetical protein
VCHFSVTFSVTFGKPVQTLFGILMAWLALQPDFAACFAQDGRYSLIVVHLGPGDMGSYGCASITELSVTLERRAVKVFPGFLQIDRPRAVLGAAEQTWQTPYSGLSSYLPDSSSSPGVMIMAAGNLCLFR